MKSSKEVKRMDLVMKNLIFSFMHNVITMVMPFILRTVTICYLGSEYLGLNSLCTSVLYVLSAAELGVGNAFVYRLYKPVASQNVEEVCRLLNLYKKVYKVIGIFIFGVGICIMPFISHFISGETPRGINIYLVFVIYLINTVLSYWLGAYKDLIFIAEQRKDYQMSVSMISLVILYTSQILCVITKQYYISIVMLPLSTCLLGVLRYFLVKKKYPQYVTYGELTNEVKEGIKKDILAGATYRFRDISRDAFDSVVLSSFLGLGVLANYQNYITVFQVPAFLISMVYNAIAPSMGNYAAIESVEDTFQVYQKNIFFQMFLSGWFAISYGFLIQDFIALWLGESFQLSNIVVFLIAVYLYLLGECSLTRMIRENAGLWKHGKNWTLVEMCANLILNIILVHFFEVEGVILATVLTVIFISVPVENYVIYKQYFKGKIIDRIRALISNILWIAFTIFAVYMLCKPISEITIMSFIYKIMVCATVPLVTLSICYARTKEYKFFLRIIRRIVFKR